MATFVIEQVTPDFVMLRVTRNTGTVFPIGVRKEELFDGTATELKKQLLQIVRSGLQAPSLPTLSELIPDIGVVQNDSQTPEEVAAAAQNAADTAAKQAARADALVTFLIEKTPAEVVARINADVTDLASARQVIGKLAVAISVLAKQGLR